MSDIRYNIRDRGSDPLEFGFECYDRFGKSNCVTCKIDFKSQRCTSFLGRDFGGKDYDRFFGMVNCSMDWYMTELQMFVYRWLLINNMALDMGVALFDESKGFRGYYEKYGNEYLYRGMPWWWRKLAGYSAYMDSSNFENGIRYYGWVNESNMFYVENMYGGVELADMAWFVPVRIDTYLKGK